MLKVALGIINLAGLIIFGIVLQDVSVADDTPSSMAPGEGAVVEMRIHKSEVTGFAKLQLELPEGLTVSPIETKGASFTFSQQKAKFIWMNLPEGEDIVIRYNLTADINTSGSKTISGSFSYIDDNDRIDYEITPRTVEISTVELLADADGDSILTESEDTDDSAPASESNDDSGSISVTEDGVYREITSLGNNSYQVKVVVNNMNIDGYAKIQEKLPPTFSIANKNSGGSVVTVDGSTIKYFWFQAPQKDKLEVIYAASTTGNLPLEIEGTFSYILDNQPTSLNIQTVSEPEVEAIVENTVEEESSDVVEDENTSAEEQLAENTEEAINTVNESIQGSIEPVEETIEEVTEEAQNVTEDVAEQEVTQTEEDVREAIMENVEEDNTTASNSTNSIPDPETGVTYRVQIAAGPNTVGRDYFRSRHNFTENFIIENHEGWVKYTTGSHKQYRGARDDRERISSSYNFNGPFVTAYNMGDRITVQEALMITNQDWLQ